MIFPIVFTNGLDPAEGPGLIFKTLPTAFVGMPGGAVFGALFFVLLAHAARGSRGRVEFRQSMVVQNLDLDDSRRRAARDSRDLDQRAAIAPSRL
jgi:NSS family neurotransmitter:Na+ symporter